MILRALLILLISCSTASALDGRREVVLLIWDDVSTQAIEAYGETDSIEGFYETGNLDDLATAGQLYLNFTSEPMCSPSRNNLWYGMNPLQHGAGRALNETNRRGVPWAQRLSLVASMQTASWQVGIVGKHHIQDWGAGALLGTATTQATAMGFDFADVMMLANPNVEYPAGTPGSPHVDGNHHYSWIETDPDTGAASVNTTYTTDAFTTAAVARLQDNSNMDPMFLVVAYSAAHSPFNPPPGSGCAASPSVSSSACYGPSIEYLDDAIPSITAELDFAEDTIIVISENGRPRSAGSTEHCDRDFAKAHATACGTRVPMIIRGVDVTTTGEVSALINIADLHDTMLELVGAPQYGAESESFLDCLANPSTCAPRTISSAVIFDPPGLPITMYEGGDFSKYEMHLTIVGGTTLYGMNRVYEENLVGTFDDKLYDLGSPTIIDEAKRYGQVEIETPSAGEQQDALAAMQVEATRLIDARWAGPPNSIVGAEMVGISTK